MANCGIIMPRYQDTAEFCTASPDDMACILEGVHGYGPHVVRTSDRRSFAWEYDYNCGCCCGPDEYDCCFVFWKIRDTELSVYQSGGPSK